MDDPRITAVVIPYSTRLFLSSQSYKPFELEKSRSHLKFFRDESETSHDLFESCQSRATRAVESPRVIGLQAQVNVESKLISHFP